VEGVEANCDGFVAVVEPPNMEGAGEVPNGAAVLPNGERADPNGDGFDDTIDCCGAPNGVLLDDE
jgi:hypothetical protein